jgi:hypothetical protein
MFACLEQAEKRGTVMANVKKVTISVTPTDELSYLPDPVEAKKLDKVWWECDYQFSISLPDTTPFTAKRENFNFNSNPHVGKHYVVADVADDAVAGTYRYEVEVEIPQMKGSSNKKLKSHSPDIIIRDR